MSVTHADKNAYFMQTYLTVNCMGIQGIEAMGIAKVVQGIGSYR